MARRGTDLEDHPSATCLASIVEGYQRADKLETTHTHTILYTSVYGHTTVCTP